MRGRRRPSLDSLASFGSLGLKEELVDSGDALDASAHSDSEEPNVTGGARTSVRRGRRRGSTESSDQASRRRSSSAEGQRAIAKFKAAIDQSGGIKRVADEWKARGKTSEMDRAAWKSSSDDPMALAMTELADIGDGDHQQGVNHDEDLVAPITEIV